MIQLQPLKSSLPLSASKPKSDMKQVILDRAIATFAAKIFSDKPYFIDTFTDSNKSYLQHLIDHYEMSNEYVFGAFCEHGALHKMLDATLSKYICFPTRTIHIENIIREHSKTTHPECLISKIFFLIYNITGTAPAPESISL